MGNLTEEPLALVFTQRVVDTGAIRKKKKFGPKKKVVVSGKTEEKSSDDTENCTVVARAAGLYLPPPLK